MGILRQIELTAHPVRRHCRRLVWRALADLVVHVVIQLVNRYLAVAVELSRTGLHTADNGIGELRPVGILHLVRRGDDHAAMATELLEDLLGTGAPPREAPGECAAVA